MPLSREEVGIAIVGCGGMGRRHLRGFQALQKSDYNNCRLASVCDINPRNAEDLADEAQQLLGYRPPVWLDVGKMLRSQPDVRGVNITTEAPSHHSIAVACMEADRDVQVEKPLGLTIRACTRSSGNG